MAGKAIVSVTAGLESRPAVRKIVPIRPRVIATLVAAVVLGGAVVTTSTPAMSDEGAVGAADALVAERPEYLFAGDDDEFHRMPVIEANGWYYVPYERTHQGLPVVGGDFVVVVDPSYRVSSTSVAQSQVLDGVQTEPEVSQDKAVEVASGLLDEVAEDETRESRLVVYALAAEPRLAWEATVTGRRDGLPSILTVLVDAVTAAVLDSGDRIVYDDGYGAYNGPSPLPIAASAVPGTPIRVLEDPVTRRLRCADSETRGVFSDVDSQWGDGDLANLETQCVDAMYAGQTMVRMLSQRLGRNGMDGVGGAWPMYVGADLDNAYFNLTDNEVQFGISDTGRPWTTIDIVAHEMGHGIDAHTPGGLSRKGTQEFIADVFAVSTEWYAAQAAPYDTPDYDLGENVSGYPRRRMYQWSAPFEPSCYHSGVDTMQEHAAAQIGDRWFYLVAEGSNPVNGQPNAYTCDGSTVTGVGLDKALAVLYHAMLMKNSNSSYQAYRIWTLSAAANVIDDNCLTYATVKAAWDAVDVPAQPGEPVCVPAKYPY